MSEKKESIDYTKYFSKFPALADKFPDKIPHELLSPETVLLEGMTSVSALIESIQSGESDRKPLLLFLDDSIPSKKMREYRFLMAKSKEMDFPVCRIPPEELNAITNGNTHGGIAILTTERTYPPLSESDFIPSSADHAGFWVLPCGIEDPYNFGYSIRSLYASGADGIVLAERNWFTAAGIVARSSAGTSEKIKTRICDPLSAIRKFKSAGYRILAAEIRNSVSLYEADLRGPLLLVIGGEKRGISRQILDQCDLNVRIPYGRNYRGSLSAAATCAIFGFEIMKYNHLFAE